MADYRRLRELAVAASHRRTERCKAEVTQFGEELERLLSSETRDALGLRYAWDEQTFAPVASFELSRFAPEATGAITRDHANLLALHGEAWWTFTLPDERSYTVESGELEDELLLALDALLQSSPYTPRKPT